MCFKSFKLGQKHPDSLWIAKILPLFGRHRKPSDQKLSWEVTYREIAASDEDWSDWDATINHGLGEDEFKR